MVKSIRLAIAICLLSLISLAYMSGNQVMLKMAGDGTGSADQAAAVNNLATVARPANILTSNLVEYFLFDEASGDRTGEINSIVMEEVSGTVKGTNIGGIAAMEIWDADSNWMVIENEPLLHATNTANWQIMMNVYFPTQVDNDNGAMFAGSNTFEQTMYYDTSRRGTYIPYTDTTTNQKAQNTPRGDDPSTGVWHFVGGGYFSDNTNIMCYFDGSMAQAAALLGKTPTTVKPPQRWGVQFTGTQTDHFLANWAKWDSVFTALQAEYYYNNGTIIEWPFTNGYYTVYQRTYFDYQIDSQWRLLADHSLSATNTGDYNFGTSAAPTFTFVNGNYPTYVEHDGTSDYITVGNSTGLHGTNGFTITTWIKGQTFNDILFDKSTSSNVQYRVTFPTGNNQRVQAKFYSQDVAGNYIGVQTGVESIPLTNWHFLSFVIGDGMDAWDDFSVHMDGTNLATTAYTNGTWTAPETSSASLLLSTDSGNSDYFSGSIGSIRGWTNTILTAAESYTLYTNEVSNYPDP